MPKIKIKIRKFENDDYIKCFNNWCNDDEVVKFLSWKKHKNINETKKIINNWINDFNNGVYQFAIVNEDNEPIGSIGITKIIDINIIHIGYALSKKYWNQGVMSDALNLFINFIIKNTNFSTIQTYCNRNNISSICVLKKNNFVYFGETNEKIKDNFNESYYQIYKLNIIR